MESETPEDKGKQGEERLYEPIKNDLELTLLHYANKKKPSKPYTPMTAPIIFQEKDVHLEVTAFAKSGFSGTLEKELDDDALFILKVEGIKPDITGFIRSEGYPQIMTIEVKDEPLKVLHFPQARFYQDVFRATYGLLISSKHIPERIIRFAVKRSDIRGNLILMQYLEQFHTFRIHPDLEPLVPDPFKTFTKPF